MTQEYTPVAWQDETTSQQGTLINAERLNQMQQAHHYADGLEEVDAIPTADPGVDYHKIVYCTADSTLYRWDGTEWTKDIDDETKALLQQEIARATEAERTIQGYLDAHEANHSNPHVVTKAQVGLGNCDNTADLDKPISTATQAALDGKADKATTLAGYGITDAYTKSQDDALLANKADKADTYTKSQVDGYLGGKVDKLGSSPAGTYRSVTVNAQGQVTAGTNPDTLAGYGITDAYTKGETDALLALKADQATTYTKAETDTLLAGKADTATVNTLDAQNVKLTGPQTVGGDKTWTGSQVFTRNYPIYFKSGIIQGTTAPSSGLFDTHMVAWDSSNRSIMNFYNYQNADASQVRIDAIDNIHNKSAYLGIHTDGYTFVNTPGAGAPSNAVATLATLDNYALMVRTVNNQKIRGIKTHVIDDINTGILRIETPSSSGSGVIGVAFDFYESTTRVGYEYIRKNSDNSYQLILGLRNSDGTFTERAL